jgi:hypothetical protein
MLKMTKLLLLITSLLILSFTLQAQKNCGTVEYNKYLLSKNPALTNATAAFEKKMAWQLSNGRI